VRRWFGHEVVGWRDGLPFIPTASYATEIFALRFKKQNRLEAQVSQAEVKEVAHSHPHVTINSSPQDGIVRPHHMHALSGIRFFAIFNIFLFHLWIVHWLEFPPPHDLIFIDFVRFPDYMNRYFSQGWMATSLFFLLSGFMLSYL